MVKSVKSVKKGKESKEEEIGEIEDIIPEEGVLTFYIELQENKIEEHEISDSDDD